MNLRTLAALGIAGALATTACAGGQKSGKSPEEQLADARQEQRGTFDRLYQGFGGSEVAGSTGGVLGHVLGEGDRSYFERQCLAVGRGERTISVSPKLKEFLGRAEVAKDCRRAHDLQLRITELEKQVAARR